ncbi:methyltransferase [Haladaptatus sp. R4]|uniref:class I SAM-dependent methyltransferase n=1 Tax=Haladaptatus sp. R4 TaxID=1679489 RepID=UPI0007B4CF07|nr:class I SAM-dependent methyltransferase [Haladaptatus sp. R4]KZN26051.1 methyltransferase [Haladaptatus sp. R4]
MSDNSSDEVQARNWWNAWSEEFQEAGGHSIAVAFGPGAPEGDDLGLLGDVSGQNAIELGCGGGQFGIALAQQGATITGVDISEEQLNYARTLAEEHDVDIEFLHRSVTDLSDIQDNTLDLAFSAFAFQWVEDLGACFSETSRVLRDGGRLVFSVDHPYYKTVDTDSHEVTRSYFSDEPRRVYSESLDAEMVIYSRGIGETVQLLTEAGFTVEAIQEPGYEHPESYESEFGSFDADLMAKVPPTVVYAAQL